MVTRKNAVMISIFLDFTTTRFFCKGTANGSQNPVHKNFCNIVAILRKKRVTLPLAMGRKLNLDIVGIGASLACAIHCAILPLFLNSLPLFGRSEEHTSELQSRENLVCRLLLEKKK